MKKVSFCIPCYRSAMTIEGVVSEIIYEMGKNAEHDYEIVTAIDGSPDKVFEVLQKLAITNERLKVINLSKNYGQPGARMAAMRYATGDYIVCLDDDGQCPMDKIWELLEPLFHEDKDVSIADYPKKKQSLFKNFGSYVNKEMTRALLDVPKTFDITNFIAMKKFVVDQILQYTNPYPYLTGLIVQSTVNFAYVKMEERERSYGTTTYTLKKLISVWLNGFTNFSIKPLRLADLLGILCALFGFGYGIAIVVKKLVFDNMIDGYASTIAAIFFVGGVIMLLLGMIGEYVGRIFMCINNTPQYVVKETINIKND